MDEQVRRGRAHRFAADYGERRRPLLECLRGSNGANQVFSFVRTGNTNSGTVDIRAIASWIRSRAWFGDVTIGNIQFGYEITSSSGGKDFVTNSFSVTG